MHHNHYHNKTFQRPHFEPDLHFLGVSFLLWVTTNLMGSRKETKYIFSCFAGSSQCVLFSTGWSPPHSRNDQDFLGLFWCSQKMMAMLRSWTAWRSQKHQGKSLAQISISELALGFAVPIRHFCSVLDAEIQAFNSDSALSYTFDSLQ